jgi:hypothetical protein
MDSGPIVIPGGAALVVNASGVPPPLPLPARGGESEDAFPSRTERFQALLVQADGDLYKMNRLRSAFFESWPTREVT